MFWIMGKLASSYPTASESSPDNVCSSYAPFPMGMYRLKKHCPHRSPTSAHAVHALPSGGLPCIGGGNMGVRAVCDGMDKPGIGAVCYVKMSVGGGGQKCGMGRYGWFQMTKNGL